MGDPTTTTLRNKFELEKWHHRSPVDFRSKAVKSQPEMEASPSKLHTEEIVKHMKHLPSYLEKGKPIQDQALTFGVMDWGKLEKWQYHHYHHKQNLVRNNKYSPSSTNSSPMFSTDGSSPQSSTGQSCSPARHKVNRVTLQSHFKATPKEDSGRQVKLGSRNLEKFQDLENSRIQSKALLNVGSFRTPPSSASKGKLKIQDENVHDDHQENHKNRIFLARNASVNRKTSQIELDFSRNQNSPPRKRTPERKRLNGFSKNSDFKTNNTEVIKPRSISPLRRFSFGSKSPAPKFSSEKTFSESPVSQNSTKDTNRGSSSPLRRLLDPIFPSKTRDTCLEDSRTNTKKKLDFRNPNEMGFKDSSSFQKDSNKQALFQTTFKNGRLLFTFAVENNKDVLAATVTSLSSSGKDDNKNWIYTFFTVNEVKKKNMNWLSQGGKTKDLGYVSNVTAQMKVSNSRFDTREFVLFTVNSNVQPEEELEAIVVKFSRKGNKEDEDQEKFSSTVILSGGTHGAPSKGGPSPLIDRWRSGGGCDCGGWDLGCRLRTLNNQVQFSGSRLNKVHAIAGQFELFFQGEVGNKRTASPPFRLSPLKEGIFSVEFNSSLSALQAFSICISIVECRKTSSQNSDHCIM